MIDIDKAKEVFKKYTQKFDMNDENIYYKYHHSYRTMEECDFLAKELNLNEEQRSVALFIGLFHDIGRFIQVKRYSTFDDHVSLDHGLEGIKILFDDKLIQECDVDTKYYNIIKKAIINHNKYKIEDGLNDEELMYAKIIRDADKLDILYSFSILRSFELNNDDSYIRDSYKKMIYDNIQILSENVTKNEKILIFLGFVFDIYYKCSLEKIIKDRYYQIIFDNLDNKELFKDMFDHIIKYSENKLKE